MSAQNDNQTVHDTFSDIAAKQYFSIDDVLEQLHKLRDSHLASYQSSIDNIFATISRGAALPQRSEPSTAELSKCHNAIVIAQSLKKNGETMIPLNPEKELMGQVLGRAVRINFGDHAMFLMPVKPNGPRMAG